MIATAGGIDDRSSAEVCQPDDQSGLQQAAFFPICQQRWQGLIDGRNAIVLQRFEIVLIVPPCVQIRMQFMSLPDEADKARSSAPLAFLAVETACAWNCC